MSRKTVRSSPLGKRFGRGIVIQQAEDYVRPDGTGHETRWSLRCDCGVVYSTRRCCLATGSTKSCGCLNIERRTAGSNRRHGLNGSPEYLVWGGMIARCSNPKHKAYPNYGGRGIAVCESWKVAANFLADMGPRPTSGHQIDRINNDGNYEPGNCRWATATEQANNRRPRRKKLRLDAAARALAGVEA